MEKGNHVLKHPIHGIRVRERPFRHRQSRYGGTVIRQSQDLNDAIGAAHLVWNS